ncbi:MAG: metalloregulator ArsR/SmtB family transcription factor [Candidatus Parvarchaeum sp.]
MEATYLFFDAFANKNRFRILKELEKGEMCAGDLQEKLKMKQTNLSHDLKCLLNCRFINVKKDGRKRIYTINPDTKELVNEVSRHIKKYEDYLKKCGILKEEENGKI